MPGNGAPLIIPIVIFLAGINAIYGGVKKHLLAQKINNTPTSKVEAAAVGLVELSGKARCHDPTISPISEVKSAYWKVLGECYHPPGKWKQIWYSDSSRPFYLEDETGKMLVDPVGADIDIPCDKLCQGYISGKGALGMAHPVLPAEALAYINGLDPAAKAIFMAREQENIRISEYYITDGDQLYVLGNAEPQGSASSRLGHENLILKKSAAENILYISNSGERNAVKKLSKDAYLKIIMGIAISVACLLFILFIIRVP